MKKTPIEQLEDLREKIYYVDGKPNLSPYAEKVDEIVDKAIAIFREASNHRLLETCAKKYWQHLTGADSHEEVRNREIIDHCKRVCKVILDIAEVDYVD